MSARRRRFGRIRQLPSGRYQARYLGPDGSDIAAPQTFSRRADADRWLAQTEARVGADALNVLLPITDRARSGHVDPKSEPEGEGGDAQDGSDLR